MPDSRLTRPWTALQAFLLGLSAAAAFWMFYRVFTVKFPLNFVSPTYATIPLYGIPIGLAFARRTPAPSRKLVAVLGGALALFVVSALAYKDKSVHYLLFGAYYDYPAPASDWVSRGLFASVPLSLVPLLITSRRVALLPMSARAWTLPALFLGIGAGLTLSEVFTPALGAYAILVGACAAVALALPDARVALVTSAAIVLAGVVMYHPSEAIFTWQLREYKRLDTYWTHHYKADWIEFDSGHCIGGVRNEIMIDYSCDVPEKVELTHLHMAESISNGPIKRERVASIGRPDGVIAMAHKARNPNLKRFVAVENDARIVGDMLTRYTRHQGEIFTRDPAIQLIAADNRRFIQDTQEHFDAMYIDGVGLMLEPFPFTVIEQENYLFSAESYRRIFDQILSKDGILVIDRGTTRSGESMDLAAALPLDVHVRSLYTKIPTYPLTGLPLVYVLASRNGAELDRIVRELVKGNLYGQDPFDYAESRRLSSDDNRPFYQPAAIAGMYVFMIPFALLTLLFVGWQLKRNVGALIRRDIGGQVLLGALFGVTAIWLTVNGARAFLAGTQMGWCYCFGALLGGMAVGYAAAFGRAPRLGLVAAALLCAGAFGIELARPMEVWSAVASSIVGGVGLGAAASTARPSVSSAVAGYEMILGILIGVYAFQGGLLIGFRLAAVVVLGLLVYLAVVARTGSLAPISTPASGPTG